MKRMLVLAVALVVGAAAASAQAQDPPDRRYAYFMGGGPRLGVQITLLTKELRTHFGAQQDAGVLVGKIDVGSAADKAGLRVGDVLVSVGGTTVTDAADVRRALSGAKEGDTMPVTVVRERKPLTLAVVVPRAEPAAEGSWPEMGFEMPREGMRIFRHDDLHKRLGEIEERLKRLEGK